MTLIEVCEGYACPPTHKVPSSEVVVETVHNLAVTGTDLALLTGGIVTATLLMLGAGILFTYNYLRNKERKK